MKSNSDSLSSGERNGKSLNPDGGKPGGVAIWGLWEPMGRAPDLPQSYKDSE